jgi:hypothetical protein
MRKPRARSTLPVGIAYVIDDSLLESKWFEVAQAGDVAIGLLASVMIEPPGRAH